MKIEKKLDNNVIMTENINFDFMKETEYLNRFEEFKERKRIREVCSFYDEKWIIGVGGEERTIKFPTELEIIKMMKEINISKNNFELGYRYYILEASEKYSFIDQANIILKNFFLKEKVNEKGACKQFNLITSFLNFMGIANNFTEKLDELLSSDEAIYESRTLPSFLSIFNFIEIIKRFEREATSEELKVYYPILLWWEITSIIPQRPSEFLNIEFDCIRANNNRYFIYVKRSVPKDKERVTNRSNVKEYYKDQKIAISKDIYDFVNKYKCFISNYVDSEKLQSKLVLDELSLNNRKKKDKRSTNEKIFTRYDFRYLLNRFFEEIIGNKYQMKVINRWEKNNIDNNEIEKLVPYDSRHIAILNLIMLGNDYKTVMLLAGHSSIKTTEGYYNHVEEYTNAYFVSYVKKLKNDLLDEDHFMLVDNLGYGKNRLERILGIDESFEVEGGICTYNLKRDKNPCLLVEGNHYKCKYFQSTNKKMRETESLIIKNRMKSEVRILKELVEGRKKNAQFDKKYRMTIENVRCELKNLVAINRGEY